VTVVQVNALHTLERRRSLMRFNRCGAIRCEDGLIGAGGSQAKSK